MDRLSALEKPSGSTRSGPSSASDNGGNFGCNGGGGGTTPAVFALSYMEIKGWCGFRDRATHDRGAGQGAHCLAATGHR